MPTSRSNGKTKQPPEFRFTFGVTVVGKLKVELGQSDVNLGRADPRFSSETRAVASAEVVVWGEGAQPIGKERRPMNGASGRQQVPGSKRRGPSEIGIESGGCLGLLGWSPKFVHFRRAPGGSDLLRIGKFRGGKHRDSETRENTSLDSRGGLPQRRVRRACNWECACMLADTRTQWGPQTQTVNYLVRQCSQYCPFFRKRGSASKFFIRDLGSQHWLFKTGDNVDNERNRRTGLRFEQSEAAGFSDVPHRNAGGRFVRSGLTVRPFFPVQGEPAQQIEGRAFSILPHSISIGNTLSTLGCRGVRST